MQVSMNSGTQPTGPQAHAGQATQQTQRYARQLNKG